MLDKFAVNVVASTAEYAVALVASPLDKFKYENFPTPDALLYTYQLSVSFIALVIIKSGAEFNPCPTLVDAPAVCGH